MCDPKSGGAETSFRLPPPWKVGGATAPPPPPVPTPMVYSTAIDEDFCGLYGSPAG